MIARSCLFENWFILICFPNCILIGNIIAAWIVFRSSVFISLFKQHASYKEGFEAEFIKIRDPISCGSHKQGLC